jgi:hypothetical protein
MSALGHPENRPIQYTSGLAFTKKVRIRIRLFNEQKAQIWSHKTAKMKQLGQNWHRLSYP